LPFLVLFTSKEEKITTTITAILALFARTISVGAALLVFKCTGNRPEFRIPGMAVEIFVGMYLFRVLAVGPVGFILAFIVSVSQSIVDLYPTPEDAVHEFLWVWVAVALGAGLGWLANLVLFPVPARRVLQREFVDGWHKVGNSLTGLVDGSPATARCSLRPLVKRGPVRLLKLLKLSLLEAHDLRPKQAELTRLVLALDKTTRLLFSYSAGRSRSAHESLPSADKAILDRLKEKAAYFERELLDGFVPSNENQQEASPAAAGSGSAREPAEDSAALQVLEARTNAFGPPKEIDPIRDRFIGIILGIFIISIVFALVWPEDARSFFRQKLAECLRSIARLLSLDGSPDSKSQRPKLELEIASHLGEANAYEEQASFEALLYRKKERNGVDLKEMTSVTEEVYAASLPWIREQAEPVSAALVEPANRTQEIVKPLTDALEASAATIEGSLGPQTSGDALTLDESFSERDVVRDASRRWHSFEQLAVAVRELRDFAPKGLKD